MPWIWLYSSTLRFYGGPHLFHYQKGLAMYGIGLDWDCFAFMMDARMEGYRIAFEADSVFYYLIPDS